MNSPGSTDSLEVENMTSIIADAERTLGRVSDSARSVAQHADVLLGYKLQSQMTKQYDRDLSALSEKIGELQAAFDRLVSSADMDIVRIVQSRARTPIRGTANSVELIRNECDRISIDIDGYRPIDRLDTQQQMAFIKRMEPVVGHIAWLCARFLSDYPHLAAHILDWRIRARMELGLTAGPQSYNIFGYDLNGQPIP